MDVANVNPTAVAPAQTPDPATPNAVMDAASAGEAKPSLAPDGRETKTLKDAAAAVFGGTSSQESAHVSVRVADHPDETVTVFYDGTTHEVLAAIPMQAMVSLAGFFDTNTGLFVDKGV